MHLNNPFKLIPLQQEKLSQIKAWLSDPACEVFCQLLENRALVAQMDCGGNVCEDTHANFAVGASENSPQKLAANATAVTAIESRITAEILRTIFKDGDESLFDIAL